jgi:membrane protease YdiL (CAAX protease family)
MVKQPIEPGVKTGFFVSGVTMTLAILFAVVLQKRWGMAGVVLTQLNFAVLSLLTAHFFDWDFKVVFPCKPPRLAQLLGVLILWLGSNLVVSAVTQILVRLFPAGMAFTAERLSEVIGSVSLPKAIVIIGVLPAVCEEIFHRGLLLYSFRFKRQWHLVVVLAVIFGIFHVNVYRFLPTAVLGAVLSYIMVKGRNLVLPIFFHLFNNVLGVLLIFADPSYSTVGEIPSTSLSQAFYWAALAPLFLLLGARLLVSKEERGELTNRALWLTGLAMLVLYVTANILRFAQ